MPDAVTPQARTRRLQQRVLNVVNNAITFTERGTVTLSAHTMEDITPNQPVGASIIKESP